MASRTKNVGINFAVGLAYRILTILLPFVTRTVVIYELGNVYLGLNGLFSSILQLFSLAELGIGSAMVYSMYKPMAEGDDDSVCALLNLYKKYYYIIGFVILIVGIAFIPLLPYTVSGELPSDVNLYVLYGIYLFNTVISYFMVTYKQSLFTASQKVSYTYIISLIVTVLQSVLQIVAVYTTHNYYLYLIAIPFATIFTNLLIEVIARKRYKKYTPFGEVEDSVRTDIKKNVAALALYKVGTTLRTSTDNIIISMFLGVAMVGLYNNYYYIVNALMMVLGIITQSLIPSVGNSIIKDSEEKNYRNFYAFNLLYVFLVSWMGICFLCLCQPFMELWAGVENLLEFSTVIIFTLYFYVHKFCDMLYVYQEAAGFWQNTKYVPLISAIVNLAVSVVLVVFIGLDGVLIGTIVSVFFVNDVGYAIKLFKLLFKDNGGIKQYAKKQIHLSMIFAITAGVTYFICTKLTIASLIGQLILRALICITVPMAIMIPLYRMSGDFSETFKYVRKSMRILKR